MGAHLVDLTGKKIGQYKIVGRAKSRIHACGQKETYWACVCLKCKRRVSIRSVSLRRSQAPRACPCFISNGTLKKMLTPSRAELVAARRYGPRPLNVRNARWIPLTRGKWALVDAEDFDRVSRFAWICLISKSGGFYAARRARSGKVSLHHDVMRIPERVCMDHENRNGLDCRKRNLRIATTSQNGANREKFKTRRFTSRYKGVVMRATQPGRWLARIRVAGHLIHIGYFPSERLAARAYDNAARRHFGPFACLNFPRS